MNRSRRPSLASGPSFSHLARIEQQGNNYCISKKSCPILIVYFLTRLLGHTVSEFFYSKTLSFTLELIQKSKSHKKSTFSKVRTSHVVLAVSFEFSFCFPNPLPRGGKGSLKAWFHLNFRSEALLCLSFTPSQTHLKSY